MKTDAQKRFLDLLNSVVKRPGMYQIESVKDIWLMTFFYQCALLGNDNISVNEILNGFRDYVNKHFKTKADYSWERLISFHSGSQIASIHLFSSLFNEYIATRWPDM